MAARKANLPWETLSSEEFVAFPDISQARPSVDLYLYLRNKMVSYFFMIFF